MRGMKTYLRCGNALRGARDQKTKRREIKGVNYPIVDTLCDLGFRCRLFAVSCWTKFLGERDAGEVSMGETA